MVAGGPEIEPYRLIWAKTPAVEPGEQRFWLPLTTHLTDTGATVRLIWHDWLGEPVKRVIRADTGGDDRAALNIAALAGSMHDIGKASRAFAGQVPQMRDEMEYRGGFTWGEAAVPADSRKAPHAAVGYVLVRNFLESCAVPPPNASAFAAVVGGHHGVPPTADEIKSIEDMFATYVGRHEWDVARTGVLNHVLDEPGLRSAVASLKEVKLSDASQLLLTAVVIMADWIASNTRLFPLVPAWQDCKVDPTRRAEQAWQQLALPGRWELTDEALSASASELLQTRFAVEFEANELQEAVLGAARAMTEPGLLLVEAIMGGGKTEASLLAAEVLATRFGAAGVFYGLPTRATTDAMFTRLLVWLQNVPGTGHTDRGVALRHGLAALNDTYRALPRYRVRGTSASEESGLGALAGGELVDVGLDAPERSGWNGRRGREVSGSAVAHHWTSGRKQASFADTVVGTIDHELLAALASRHVVLRHLGLARQVVVLDEVHAADTWMFVYLERALEWLGRYGAPVIAMSATLAPDQRNALVAAYERGRRASLDKRTRRSLGQIPTVTDTDEYPLITSLTAGRLAITGAPSGPSREVALEWLADDTPALVCAVDAVVQGGGCVLVVRNTVRRAVGTYRELRELWGESVTLAHSRYTGRDRMSRDQWLRETFGPGEGDRAGRVVVSTQVAEQSLDVDFDLLVTDLAPIDLILQRVGRLHRHAGRNRPTPVQRPRCLISGLAEPAAVGTAPVLDAGAVAVYGAHLLLRTAALVLQYTAGERPLRLPEDVPVLVRRCYGQAAVVPAAWQGAAEAAALIFAKEASEYRSGAETYRLRAPGERGSTVDLLAVNAGEAETSTGATKQVRNTDGGFEVILLVAADDGLRLLPHFCDGRAVPTDERPSQETSRLLAQSMVRVPAWVTSNQAWTDQVLDDLARNFYRGWQKDPVLAGQLVLLLNEKGAGTMGPFDVTYDAEVGLEVIRD